MRAVRDEIGTTPLASLADAEFRAWLAGCGDARIYASPDFGASLQEIAGGRLTYLVARRGGAIVGALPYLESDHPDYGRVVNSLPWYGSHGGCTLADPADAEARAALVRAFRARALGDRLLSATMILTHYELQHIREYASILAPRTTDDRIGQTTELPLAGPFLEARLEAVVLQKTRNLVRKSLRQGFREVLTDDDWAWRFLYETHVENMAAVGGRAKPWRHFEIFRRVLPPESRRLSIAVRDTVPVAAMLLFRFNATVDYVTPVVKLEYRSAQPLSFLIWRAMISACEEGFRRWNWGGTWRSQHSLLHFKAGWGAREEPYAYLVCASDEIIERLQREPAALGSAFDFYYLYPFDQLPRT